MLAQHLLDDTYLRAQWGSSKHDQARGVPLRAFKSQVTSALRKRYGDSSLQLWAPGYHDWAVWKRGSLVAYTHYILDNPRRYCLRKAHPDLFRRVNDLRHPRLPPGEAWTGYGNLFLLDKPDLHALQVSRRITASDLDALKRDMLERVQNGGVLISGCWALADGPESRRYWQ